MGEKKSNEDADKWEQMWRCLGWKVKQVSQFKYQYVNIYIYEKLNHVHVLNSFLFQVLTQKKKTRKPQYWIWFTLLATMEGQGLGYVCEVQAFILPHQPMLQMLFITTKLLANE